MGLVVGWCITNLFYLISQMRGAIGLVVGWFVITE